MNISMENRKPPRMRTIPQADKQLKDDGIDNISAYTIRRWVKAGLIPVVHCGNKALINYDRLIEFLSCGEVRA